MEADTEIDFSTVCRTCLKDSELSPIFINSEDNRQFSKALLLASGVNVDPNDGFPQNMCKNCIEFVNKSLQFRETCREVQKKLLQQLLKQNIKNQLEMSDSISNHFEDNEISFEQDKTKRELIPKLESKITNTNNLNAEYTDLEVIEHLKNEDDKSLEYLDTNTEVDIKSQMMFMENLMEPRSVKDENEDDKSLEYLDTNTEADIKMQMMFTENLMETSSSEEDETPEPSNIVKPSSGPYKTKRLTCKLCHLPIRNVYYHMSRYHPEATQRKEQCGLCDKFITKMKFERHLKLANFFRDSSVGRKEQCGLCDKFITKKEFERHLKQIHGTERP